MRAQILLGDYAAPLDVRGFHRLQAARDGTCLASFYSGIPKRYPPLFESLCLTYSWEEAALGEVEFAANPPARDLAHLAASIRYDSHLWSFLVPRGYLIFGRMAGGRYDPVAFNTNACNGHDAPVVRIDHEEILSFERLGHPLQLAPSFRALLETAILGGGGAA